MGVYFVGLLAFIALLTVRSPWFAFFTWFGFMHAFRFLTGAWRWVGCVLVALVFGVSQGGGFHRPTVSRSPSGCFWPAWTSCSWACSSCWA